MVILYILKAGGFVCFFFVVVLLVAVVLVCDCAYGSLHGRL